MLQSQQYTNCFRQELGKNINQQHYMSNSFGSHSQLIHKPILERSRRKELYYCPKMKFNILLLQHVYHVARWRLMLYISTDVKCIDMYIYIILQGTAA